MSSTHLEESEREVLSGDTIDLTQYQLASPICHQNRQKRQSADFGRQNLYALWLAIFTACAADSL